MAIGLVGSREDERASAHADAIRTAFERLPRLARFLLVGGCGLVTDLGIFTLLHAYGAHPLAARVLSLGLATLVTWRLNRHLTFDPSGRRQADEAVRYALVAACAQGIGYAIFAALALTVLAFLPQLAILIGAAAVTVISYNGHRLVAFLPRRACVATM